jgi:UDP-glucose:glycoprotein glucosyltransferase
MNGFDFNKLNEKYPDDKEKLDEFKQFLVDESNPMAPLKVWQLQDLSLQTAARVLNSPKDLQLSILADLSQNFPSHARQLSKTSVPKELKKAVKGNRDAFYERMNLQPTDAALFINGLHYDMDYVDIFTILDAIKSEAKILDGLGRLGLSDEQASKMISLDFSSGTNKPSYGIDIRDTAVNWINDLEKDKQYQGWPESVMEMLRPTFPGMMRSVRKNFFNIAIFCDPSKAACKPLIKMLESFYLHRAPTRIGIVFTVQSDLDAFNGQNDAGVAFLNAFNFISAEKSATDALAFITDVYSKIDDEGQDIPLEEVHATFKATYGELKATEVFEADSEFDVGRILAKDFLGRSGFDPDNLPQVLMNGVPMDKKNMNAEDFEEALMMSIMKETTLVQKAIYRNQLKDEDNCLDYLMKQDNIMPRLNDRVLKIEGSKYLDLTGEALPSLKLDTFASLTQIGMMAGTLSNSFKYLSSKDDSKLHMLTAWVVVDLERPQGRELVLGALSQIKSSNQLRIALVHNTKTPGLASKAAQAAIKSQSNTVAIRNILGKILKEDTLKNLVKGKKKLEDYEIPGADMESFIEAFKNIDEELFEIHRLFASKALAFDEGSNGVLVNGRIIGPLEADETFGIDDFNLLEQFSMSQFGEKMVNAFYTNMDTKDEKASDLAMKLSSLLVSRPESKARTQIQFSEDKVSVIKIDPSEPEKPSFDIVAVIDPTSKGAQKISSTLLALSKAINARIRIFMNCVEKHSQLPQKSYFRVVLEPELTFTALGELTSGPMAKFNNLPEDPVFTMHHHIPDNWLIEPVKSIYDLDNIKLANVEGTLVHSEFELEYLLLEGHCFEAYTGNPPRGLQMTLGTKNEPVVVDTIVMANLGYLQLKSSPGRWLLRLREGRSTELYDIVSVDGADTLNEDIPVFISSFQSKIVKLRVAKKPEMRDQDLLESDESKDKDSGLWNSITTTFSGGVSNNGNNGNDDTLNIFCLASGHLYERLLKIMMLSVIRTTKAPKVKFWVLKSYLSPTLKEFLPAYAAKYGFDYEYVQYKWPRWLNQQSEKQRIIWGYKILFLDVMFPLDVKKIIFVDTDQIVRADLLELRDMDLGGAPYGYVILGFL